MRKRPPILLFSILLLNLLILNITAIAQNTTLKGINCKLEPIERAGLFQQPVKSVGKKEWQVSENDFGNIVTNKDVPGLPVGYWQHTGVDYLLNGRSIDSQGQMIYAAGSGVVIFSTTSNPNPLPKRGGLLIIRHLAPQGEPYQIPKYEKAVTFGKESTTISYSSYQTNEILTYYLHLDPEQILVKQGDQVRAGQPIARLYYSKDVPRKYVYVPHLHFEIWTKCVETERNGYDIPGDKQCLGAVTNPLIDPVSFLTGKSLLSDKPQQLRRYDPEIKNYEITKLDSNKIYVNYEKNIPLSDMSMLIRYLSDQFRNLEGNSLFYIYKPPLGDNFYYALTLDYEKDRTIFLLLRKQEAKIVEIDRIPGEVRCDGLINSVFFIGNGRALIVTSFNAMDGGFCGNYAFEYKDDRLRAVGEIPVYDGVHGPGAYQGHSPMERAVAEYKSNTYYVTMRGEGNLYALSSESLTITNEGPKEKRLAPPRTPITFYLDGSTWRLLQSRQTRRR
jgi:murein DD-endopeptidase MepM/ murein hydrolase activator NlpD